jgi:hypothetical protein
MYLPWLDDIYFFLSNIIGKRGMDQGGSCPLLILTTGRKLKGREVGMLP